MWLSVPLSVPLPVARNAEQSEVFRRGASIAADVISLRLAHGLTQTELADALYAEVHLLPRQAALT